jgi:hypothetical protein
MVMNKENARQYIDKSLSVDDALVDFFFATEPLKIWLMFFIGPFVFLTMRYYFVAVTKNGIKLHRLNMFSKFTNSEFYQYKEIESVKVGKGLIQRPIKFNFKNGRSLNLKAQIKGASRVAKMTEDAQKYIESNINKGR